MQHDVIVTIPGEPVEEQQGKYITRMINFKWTAITLGQKIRVDDSLYNYLIEKIPTPKRQAKPDGTADIVDVLVPRFNVVEVTP